MVIDDVAHVAQTLAQVFEAKKINYELLGNQVPHMHWYLIPWLKTDSGSLKPVWCVLHEPVRLSSERLAERVQLLKSVLCFDPNQPD
ncbi:MAG: hypothetical protein MRJ67_03820 [Nitrospirales bacterium]|nr:hypothetical protein [Nitrospirales bacterium]